MTFLPISINISEQQILLVGGGKVALHKIKLLKRFTSDFKVIAPKVLEEIKGMDGVEIEEREYEEADLKGYLLVYATTDNHELNHLISIQGKQYGCLVNVADNAVYSDFVSPAIYKCDEFTIAVGSDGRDVKASIALRNKIRDFLQNSF